jgi:DNA-binding IclR family transcriptional regulator
MRRPIQSIERAVAVLRLLASARRLGVVELAGELNLAKATVHGILRTLQHVGLVEQDAESGKYELGPTLLQLGSSYLGGNELRTRALDWSESLAASSGESVRIGTLHDGQVLVVHHVFGRDDGPQAPEVGALLPAHATAMGKVLLAAHGHEPQGVVEEGLSAYTGATITGGRRLARELDHVRSRGWAGDVEELVEGQATCAAPITDRRGTTVGAMGISGSVERLCEGRELRGELVTRVREAARAVSRELGAIAP